MLEDNKAYASNSFETLTHLKGETIVGVVRKKNSVGSGFLIIFESGYSFYVSTANGAYWIESKTETSKAISEIKHQLQIAKHELETISEIAGILPC